MTEKDMARCKTKIIRWLEQEYGENSCHESDFDDLEHVGLIFSADGGNDEHTVVVELNLNTLSFVYIYDDEVVEEITAENIAEFTKWLDDMDWQEEYGICVRKGRKDE